MDVRASCDSATRARTERLASEVDWLESAALRMACEYSCIPGRHVQNRPILTPERISCDTRSRSARAAPAANRSLDTSGRGGVLARFRQQTDTAPQAQTIG